MNISPTRNALYDWHIIQKVAQSMKRCTYIIAINLKSVYASVGCREQEIDPLDTKLVVVDESRTDKTIFLAVTPSLKAHGISGRARLFKVVQQMKEANCDRLNDAPGHCFPGKFCLSSELIALPELEIDYCCPLTTTF